MVRQEETVNHLKHKSKEIIVDQELFSDWRDIGLGSLSSTLDLTTTQQLLAAELMFHSKVRWTRIEKGYCELTWQQENESLMTRHVITGLGGWFNSEQPFIVEEFSFTWTSARFSVKTCKS